MIDTGIQHGP